MVFRATDRLRDVANRDPCQTTLEAWFAANQRYPEGRELTYHDFPSRFVYHASDRVWRPRVRGSGGGTVIGRMHIVHPRDRERFFLRALLVRCAGATCFEDLRRGPDGTLYDTFAEAAVAHGLVCDDELWVQTLSDAALTASARDLRSLFCIVLLFADVQGASALYERFKFWLSEDFNQGLQHGDALWDFDRALVELDRILIPSGRRLSDFIEVDGGVPDYGVDVGADEFHVDTLVDRVSSLNEGQRHAYDTICHAIESGVPEVFFVNAPGGTGMSIGGFAGHVFKVFICELCVLH